MSKELSKCQCINCVNTTSGISANCFNRQMALPQETTKASDVEYSILKSAYESAMGETIKAFCLECGAKYHTWLSESTECPHCEGQMAFHDTLEQKEESWEDEVTSKIIEMTERIVIDYVNYSGRAGNRPEFRGATMKNLILLEEWTRSEERQKVKEEMVELVKEYVWKTSQSNAENHNEVLIDIIRRIK